MDGGKGWGVAGRINPSLGPFGVAVSPRSASNRSKHT